MLNIVFMGTPDFAQESLKGIYEADYNILATVTTVDKPKGRGMKLTPSPVKEYALEKKLKLYQPEKIRDNKEFIEEIKKLNPDVICVVAYGKILPKEFLEIPKYGCINVHPSLLPKYRGSTPIQTAIINGDKTTGVTTMYMDEGLDSGDMILQEEIEIKDNETAGDIWNKLSKIGANLLVETLKQIENGTAKRIAQGEIYSVTHLLDKSMSKINWEEKDAIQIKNLARGLNPIMGIYTILNGKKIKFWDVDALTLEDFVNNFTEFKNYKERLENEVTAGTIVYIDYKEAIYIKAKIGIVKVKEIQGENAKRMPVSEFLKGNKLETSETFQVNF